jgi:hypothetical protein
MSQYPDPIVAVLDSITSIEACVQELKMTVHELLIPQADRISELENMVNPFSDSGEAICNWSMEDDYEY